MLKAKDIYAYIVIFLMAIYIVLSRAYMGSDYIYYNAVFMLLGCFAGVYLKMIGVVGDDEAYISIILFAVMLFILLSKYFGGGDDFIAPFIIMLMIFGAYYMSRLLIYLKYDDILLRFILILLVLYIIYCVIIYDFGYYSYDNIFNGSSRNVVSGWVIFLSVAIISIQYLKKGDVLLWPAVLSVLVSMLFTTRSSILFSLMMLLGVSLKKYKPIYVLVVVLVILIISIYGDVSLMHIYENTKYYTDGLESGRYYAWARYIESIDFFALIFGKDLMFNQNAFYQSLNPHNSFIRLHSYFGVMPFVIFIIFMMAKFKNINKFVLFLLLIMLGRSATDILLWGYDMMDIAYFVTFIKMAKYNNTQ